MTLRDTLLPSIDKIRGIPGRLGIRLFRVFIQTTDVIITGDEDMNFGEGTPILQELEIVNVDGYPPHVRLVSTQEIVASNGLYVDQDLRIGPITPHYTTGGFAPDDVNPLQGPDRILNVRILGPGYPDTGAVFRVQSREFTSPLHYTLVVRKTGV